MSGTEEPTFIWQFSIGTILTIITTLSIVGGGFMAFLRHLRATKETSERALAKIDSMLDTIKDHERTTTEHLDHNLDRINELKNMMQMINNRINEVKSDVNKRVDEREREIEDLARMLQRFQEELHKLVLDVEKRLTLAADEDRRADAVYRDQDRIQRRIERRTDRQEVLRENQRREDYEGDVSGHGSDSNSSSGRDAIG